MGRLFAHQKEVVSKLKTGSILWGGVGSGKSIAAIAYYIYANTGNIIDEFGTKPIFVDKKLYVITTAKKRDSKEWEKDYGLLKLDPKNITVDSWNNIANYVDCDGFFIFDEQKAIGSGTWSKSFIKIARRNDWILATATPGDTWSDYIPVFIANGYFSNRSDFLAQHVVFSPYTKYPKIDRYLNEARLDFYKKQILVEMKYSNSIVSYVENVPVLYDKDLYSKITKERFDPYKNQPVKQIGELYYLFRKVVNSDPSRLGSVIAIFQKHKRLIVFYSFDYELEILRTLNMFLDCPIKEQNGHKHDPLPEGEEWIYLVQYASGAEAWNCITTNTVVFYSLSYSFKLTSQAGGRVDRANTPYANLYYYYLVSESPIDKMIMDALLRKQDFNERSDFENLDLA